MLVCDFTLMMKESSIEVSDIQSYFHLNLCSKTFLNRQNCVHIEQLGRFSTEPTQPHLIFRTTQLGRIIPDLACSHQLGQILGRILSDLSVWCEHSLILFIAKLWLLDPGACMPTFICKPPFAVCGGGEGSDCVKNLSFWGD